MNDRRTELIERIGEDEGLTGDLEGDAALALRQWADTQARREASADQHDDAFVSQRISIIRTVARTVAAQAANRQIDVVAEAQRQYHRLCTAPDTTMIIRTGPISAGVTPKKHWWQRMLFWRSTL